MSHKSHHLIAGIVLVAGTIFSDGTRQRAGDHGTRRSDQDVQFVKIGSDTGGYSVVEEGTVLAIQKGGILAVPYSGLDRLQDEVPGRTNPRSRRAVGRRAEVHHGKIWEGADDHLFAKNDKVYPTKIDVNVAKDTVTMGIVACDTCNSTDPPTYNKAEVVFEFPKGSLASATTPSVQKIIAQVFVVSKDDSKDAKKDDKGGDKGGDQRWTAGGRRSRGRWWRSRPAGCRCPRSRSGEHREGNVD